MRHERSVLGFLFLGLAASFLTTSDSWAYLDPGTGSIVFQTVIALLVGIAFTVKLYWQRLKAFFRRRANPGGEDEGPDARKDRDGGD